MSSHFYGPLRVHPDNGRYFTDERGKAIYLTGSHTWANLQDIGLPGNPPFPFSEYLDFMRFYHHNFMRLWMFEQPERACWTDKVIVFNPLPWVRTGPGLANDDKPKFDLTVWNQSYFDRLRQRVIDAGKYGIYCAVMLFQGWSLSVSGKGLDPWLVHPFNMDNNVNEVTVLFTGWDDDIHSSLHSMHNPQVLTHQENYVRKVIDTLYDLDNVLYEIINEGGSLEWQIHIVDFIHANERSRSKQHPVGSTSGTPWIHNASLVNSTVDWFSPASQPNWWDDHSSASLIEDYKEDPPVADGRKVMVPDTDHLWGHGGNFKWVWKCFTRGHNPIFMDPWQSLYLGSSQEIAPWTFTGGIKDQRDYPDWEPVRRAMGDTRRYAQRVDLVQMTPCPDLVSTRYCLANPGQEYLVYLPQGGAVTVDLNDTDAQFKVEWFLPQLGRTLPGARPLPGGDYVVTVTPFTGDAVLYLSRIE